MIEILEKINKMVDCYESGEWQSQERLSTLLRHLTTANYRLSKHNIEYHQQYNKILFLHTGSVASGKIKAEEEVPELRMLRKIMDQTDNVIWSIRSEISLIKKEQ